MADSTRFGTMRIEARSLEIVRRGYRVIRFWNGDVMEKLAGVLETIRRELDFSLSTPGGGEGRGEAGGAAVANGPTHLTLPAARRDGSPPSPP